jgi:hypothetical protein
MAEIPQQGWTRIRAQDGRYEYQFQGRTPAVRNGRYKDATEAQLRGTGDLPSEGEYALLRNRLSICHGAACALQLASEIERR